MDVSLSPPPNLLQTRQRTTSSTAAGITRTLSPSDRQPGHTSSLSEMTHRVTVKTLKHDVVHLDLPHDCTVDECKEHLRAHRPDWRGEQQLRLMSNGKQLTAGTLAAAGVFEYVEAAADRFIVALLTPTKPAATPAKAVVLPTLPVTAPSRKRSGGNESFLVACAQRLRDTAVSAEAKGRRQWASAGPTAPPPPPAPAEWLIAAPTPSEAAEAAAQAAETAREAATHAAALEVVQAAEALAQLMAMGFGEAEAARALRAARGRCLRTRFAPAPHPLRTRSAPAPHLSTLHLLSASSAPPLPPLHHLGNSAWQRRGGCRRAHWRHAGGDGATAAICGGSWAAWAWARGACDGGWRAGGCEA